MSLFDYDDVEDILEDDYQEIEKNIYLADSERAIELVGKIISISRNKYYELKNLKKIDYLMDADFLGCLKKIQLNDEAQLQIKLTNLSDKLMGEKKYQVLKNKSVIGIGGKFSAGKSKFINSLLKAEEELLPEDQNPTTSIPTYIVYGEEEQVNAYTMDNSRVLLDVESMQALTHKFYDKYKMGFSSFINSLIIMEPDMPYSDLAFLDTPGYSKADTFGNSKTQKNITDENKAYEQLKGADFLIWLVDIENGVLSETDIDFITKLNIETPILIVINKADKKISSETEEVVNCIETTVAEVGINCYAVTAYSSRTGKEWNDNTYIVDFLENAKKQKKSKEDILAQITHIENQVSREIDSKINVNINERNNLNDVIFKSNDIMEIKTLIDIYGKTMENIRDMRKCKSVYNKNIHRLENLLDRHFERRKS